MTYSIESFLYELDFDCALESFDCALESWNSNKVIDGLDNLINKILSFIMQLYAKIRGIKKIYVSKKIINEVDVVFDNIKKCSIEDDIFDKLSYYIAASNNNNNNNKDLYDISFLKNKLSQISSELKNLKSDLKHIEKNDDKYKEIKTSITNYNKLVTYINKIIYLGIRNIKFDNSDLGKAMRYEDKKSEGDMPGGRDSGGGCRCGKNAEPGLCSRGCCGH